MHVITQQYSSETQVIIKNCGKIFKQGKYLTHMVDILKYEKQLQLYLDTSISAKFHSVFYSWTAWILKAENLI